MSKRDVVLNFIQENDGVLRLRPAWVAHDFLAGGHRLNLKEEEYDCGERGEIMERWFCSETHAVNTIDIPTEGISFLEIPGEDITIPEALKECRMEILGEEYGKTHDCLGRLVKIYDFKTRLFLHIHQKQEDLNSQGKVSKDEAYHYLDAPLGDHPESFFGVHRYIVEKGLQYKTYLPLLQAWDCKEEELLRYSFALQNVPGEGFYLDSGILHAPGTALTMEIQEPSDVGAIYQPNVNGYPINKKMLGKDVAPEAVEKYGSVEMAALHQIDWEASADPDFFEKRHLYPKPCEQTRQGTVCEEWIYYGTPKFSGKRLILHPGEKFFSKEAGVHNIFVWHGTGLVNGKRVTGAKCDLHSCEDELLVVCKKAQEGYWIENDGDTDLYLYKYFGRDIYTDTDTPAMGHSAD